MREWVKRFRPRIEEEFEDHEATLEQHGPVTLLNWQRHDGSWLYWVRYFFHEGALMVYGDLGEAVYRVPSKAGLDFWATSDLHYFHSKCDAAAEGRHPYQWDEKEAVRALKQYRDDDMLEDPSLLDDAIEAAATKWDWDSFFNDSGYELFGDSYAEMYDVGHVTEVRCIYHWLGLKMAHKQLAMKEQAAA